MPAFELRNVSLFQDGKALVCPFVPRHVVPSTVPEKLNIVGTECGSWCPLFELWLSEDDMPPQALLHCGSGKRIIAPIKVIEQPKKFTLTKTD